MAELCLQLQQILKDVHERAQIKEDKKLSFKFENPSSGKLVGVVEEARGNGWAVAINGSTEVNPLTHDIVHMYVSMYI